MTDMIPHPDIVAKLSELNEYQANRRAQYGFIEEQLDKLFDDIDSGLFGENAKTGQFYTFIKGVKDANPKPDVATLEAELEALFEQHSGE